MTDSDTEAINRRAYLATLSAVGAAGAAGCIGSDEREDDEDEDDRGERVPEVIFQWPTGLGATTEEFEESTLEATNDLEEHLGVITEANPRDVSSHYDEIYGDERTFHLTFDTHLAIPIRIDPDEMLSEAHILQAGGQKSFNRTQYANCEFSELASESRKVSDPTERKAIVQQAVAIASEDVERINIRSEIRRGVWRTDQLELTEEDLGAAGLNIANTDLYLEAEPASEDTLTTDVAGTMVENDFHLTTGDGQAQTVWNNLIYHPLIRYDKDYEIIPGIATEWEIANDASTYTFYLRDDATFHNGEPVTAEDVKWTYELLEEHSHLYNDVQEWEYESIEIIDERTIEINLPGSDATYQNVHAAMWGILPKDVFVESGIEEDPTNPDLEVIVGSGPFEVRRFEQGEFVQLEPYDAFWDPANVNVTFRVFQDLQSAYREFQEGNVNVIDNVTGGVQEQIEEDMNDVAEVSLNNAFFDTWLIPQNNHGPTKFREFRLAISHVINRAEINQITTYGDADNVLYSSLFGETHPFYPENPEEVLTQIAESPTGDPDRARQILEEAGWTWDDEGRLRYPEDADLGPVWPQGDEPADHPDQFPCTTELDI